MRKYFIDSLVIGLSLITALLWAEKPKVSYETAPAVSRGGKNAEETTAQPIPLEVRAKRDNDYRDLERRNIFSPDGSYALLADKKPLPEIPYSLLGIIQGKTQKAVFREHTGAIVSVGEGDSLLDGSVVKSIERLSVMVQRGGETKEYRIFDWRAKSGRSDGGVVPPPSPAPSSRGGK